MPCLREKVNGAEFGGAPAEAGEGGHIACQCFGVTADIDDALGLHPVYGGDTLRCAAGARRVQKDHIGAQPLRSGGHHPFRGIGADKAGVGQLVAAGVGGGVPDGGGVALNTDDLLCMGRGAQADRADAAIGIYDRLASGQSGKLKRLFVQHLGLGAVDLIKAAGRDCKLQPAQRIQHKAGSPKRFLAVAQHGAAARGVDVLYDADDPRRFFAQRGAEIFAAGQVCAGRYQRDQHLTVPAAAQHGMAQQPCAAVLVIGSPAAGAGGLQHGGKGLVEDLLLQQAVGTWQDPVRALGIQAADQSAVLHGKAGDGLVAVMVRLGHALHGPDGGKPAQQPLQAGLFLVQLFPVGQCKQRTAAAFFIIVQAGSGHGYDLSLHRLARCAIL